MWPEGPSTVVVAGIIGQQAQRRHEKALKCVYVYPHRLAREPGNAILNATMQGECGSPIGERRGEEHGPDDHGSL